MSVLVFKVNATSDDCAAFDDFLVHKTSLDIVNESTSTSITASSLAHRMKEQYLSRELEDEVAGESF